MNAPARTDAAGRGGAPDALLEQALILAGLSPENLDRARQAAATGRERLAVTAARLGLADGVRLADALAQIFAMPRFAGAPPPRAAVPDGLNADWLRRKHMAVLEPSGAAPALIGVADPSDTDGVRACAFALRCAARFAVITLDDWARAWDDLAARAAGPLADDKDVETLADLSRGAPAVRVVEEALAAARRAGASDVHFRPSERGLSVQIRVDGELQTLRALPAALTAPAVARLKVLAGLDLAERRAPQDGRLSLTIDGAAVDARLSTAPTVWGESAVVRLLGRSEALLSFHGLGFSAAQEETMSRWLDARSGMVVIAGPTGAGKTTTLYAAINRLRGTGRNILTIEDPVEYLFEGVSQTQVDRAAGVDFSSALRAFLRHDPDVIMVGEIRDRETAALAVRAALTGHLVLTSLHADSAAAAVVRLIDLGVEPFLAATTLTGVAAQRLARRVCAVCAGAGCNACQGAGRKGRIALIEMLDIDESVRAAMIKGADALALARAARPQAHARLADDAEAKASAGLVDRAEALVSVS